MGRSAGLTQNDLLEGQIRDRGWHRQKLPLGKSHILPISCSQEDVLIDGVGQWPDPASQPSERTVAKVDPSAPSEPPELMLMEHSLPSVQTYEQNKCKLLFLDTNFRSGFLRNNR